MKIEPIVIERLEKITNIYCNLQEQELYYDKETKIIYTYTKSTYGGTFMIMTDKNKQPMLYEK